MRCCQPGQPAAREPLRTSRLKKISSAPSRRRRGSASPCALSKSIPTPSASGGVDHLLDAARLPGFPRPPMPPQSKRLGLGRASGPERSSSFQISDAGTGHPGYSGSAETGLGPARRPQPVFETSRALCASGTIPLGFGSRRLSLGRRCVGEGRTTPGLGRSGEAGFSSGFLPHSSGSG